MVSPERALFRESEHSGLRERGSIRECISQLVMLDVG